MPDNREDEVKPSTSSSSSTTDFEEHQLQPSNTAANGAVQQTVPSENGVTSYSNDTDLSDSESDEEQDSSEETEIANRVDRSNDVSYLRINDYFIANVFPLYEPRNIIRVANEHGRTNHTGSVQNGRKRQYIPVRRRWQTVDWQTSELLPTPEGPLPILPHHVSNGDQNPSSNNNDIETATSLPPAMMQAILDQNKLKNHKKGNKKNSTDTFKFEPYLDETKITEGLKNNTLVEGTIRINPKQFQLAYLSGSDRSEPDIFIDGIKNRNRALEGDVVVVELLSDGESEDCTEEVPKKRGKVVYIREKTHKRVCLGTLKLMPDKNRNRALFIPRDSRLPRLNIPCTNWPNNFYNDSKKYEQTLFLAKIFDWFDTRYALGKIVILMGQSGDIIVESKAILAQNDLDVKPYGPEIRKLFPSDDYIIDDEEIKLREDCRQLCLFSIDPYNCRDIDDAVSCRKLNNGNYEVGVHISDVAHYLTENTSLDEQVAEKATTIYMVDQAYHMLPDELCVLCSLFPGEDKLAFSVFWEITEDGTVLSHRFAKTVIHSCCQLAYEHAQAILDDEEDAQSTFPEIYNDQKYEDVKKTIKTLGIISAIFRKNRFDTGALRIDQPKVSFKLNPTNLLPESFSIYDSKTSHQLIEEFMLLANMTVAKRIYDDYPDLAFLRCHPPPSLYMMRQLQKSLLPMGIDLDITSAGTIHRSLLKYANPDSTDKGRAMVLSMLCAKPMARAKYFCAGCKEEDDDFSHYALNVPLYTHFTSPIRRYADIMVHRLLAASIKYREAPNWQVDRVRAIAAQCNRQKYNAKRAGEMSTELYILKYIQMHSPVVTEAVVVDVREKFMDVIIVAMGLNRRIHFNNDFPGTYKFIKNDAGAKLSKMEITWNGTDTEPEATQLVEVFSVLTVEISEGEDVAKVETKIVRPAAVADTC